MKICDNIKWNEKYFRYLHIYDTPPVGMPERIIPVNLPSDASLRALRDAVSEFRLLIPDAVGWLSRCSWLALPDAVGWLSKTRRVGVSAMVRQPTLNS